MMRIPPDDMSRLCYTKEETAKNIFCDCETLAGLRRNLNLDKHFAYIFAKSSKLNDSNFIPI